MSAVLYVETNFLVGFARGRSAAVELFVTQPIAGVRILVPSPCVMESLAVLEWSGKEHRRFVDQMLRPRIRECERDVTSPDRAATVSALDAARSALEDQYRRFESRLQGVLERLEIGGHMEVFEAPLAALRRVRSEQVMDDPTDSLVLWSVAEHAAARGIPGEERIFYTEDAHFRDSAEAKAILAGRGVRFEHNADALLARLADLSRGGAVAPSDGP